ncbi:protein tyrosine phosphatase type IVA [Entomortierella parvispora]|uniref:protein-tyrosine-phosphatase n=1 Tax=Entomortierella parvispora TaxID=205924 RepID=A0A9P3HAV9_9FUNG|nr:protein tyrosine phosphatase type IVA [Entomortierella parvispora]
MTTSKSSVQLGAGSSLARPSPATRLLNPPTVIEYQNMRFLVTDAPSDSNIALYVAEFERQHVKDVVRVCDPTYGTTPLTDLGIAVHDWPFADGEGPPSNIMNDWLALVKKRFGTDSGKKPAEAIVVHCVAGLGRAPLLVALALMDVGLSAEESIEYVRKYKRHALNATQVRYILSLKKKNSRKGKCNIM